MNILYISTVCSKNTFNKIFENSKIKPQQQAQKFHKLLSDGLSKYVDNIYFLSRPPINKTTDKIKLNEEIEGNKIYIYLKVSKYPIIKDIKLFFSILYNITKWDNKNNEGEKIIICDILNLSISISALFISKIKGIKIAAIVTDLPNYMNYCVQYESIIQKLYKKLYKYFINRTISNYDYYIFLTQYMNNLVNKHNKPYIIIEGMVDLNMSNIDNKLDNKYKEKIIMYSGALYKKYGVKKMIEAFLKVKDSQARLWLFGDGDLVEVIKKYEEVDKRIKYFGVIPNEEVVREQIKATILINPRPTVEEFTKYSFPSKIMEYMVSGTPVLTTKLAGMPEEYYDHVYLIEDESIDGIAKTIENLLNEHREKLHKKGLMAKEYVLKEKKLLYTGKKIN